MAGIGSTLLRHKHLIWELTKRDVRDRYVGQFLGTVWSIAHPIFLMGLYVFIFAVVFPARFDDDVQFPRSYTVFILSGLIPWLTFQEVLNRSVTVMIQNGSLVKQIVFPIEVLPVKTVMGTFTAQFVSTAILAAYTIIYDDGLTLWWLMLPILWILQTLAMLGAAYLLAAIGTYVRDLKDVVQLFTTANLFLVPILYSAERVPESLRFVFYLNPFSYLVWCYQDVTYFGRIEHPVAWVVLVALSVGSFVLGVATFERWKHWFGDVL
jgi:lipopolysaccharide transport system permease protein